VISCRNVFKTYPKQLGMPVNHALKGISFHLKQGQTLGLIGANGAGKSTTIRILMDFIRPDSGQVQILGKSVDEPELRKNIGFLPEVASFPQHLTCMDMLLFAGRSCDMSHTDIKTQSKHWLRRLNLWSDRNRPLKSFSKGMQQRANFALALLHNPELLILDEPMSGLDPIGRADIVTLIHELKQQGKSILFCSHLLNDIERVADSIFILHQGQCLLQEEMSNIHHDARSLEAVFLDSIHNVESRR